MTNPSGTRTEKIYNITEDGKKALSMLGLDDKLVPLSAVNGVIIKWDIERWNNRYGSNIPDIKELLSRIEKIGEKG